MTLVECCRSSRRNDTDCAAREYHAPCKSLATDVYVYGL